MSPAHQSFPRTICTAIEDGERCDSADAPFPQEKRNLVSGLAHSQVKRTTKSSSSSMLMTWNFSALT
jgi:UDP-N-acetylglucosamine 2-epimerase